MRLAERELPPLVVPFCPKLELPLPFEPFELFEVPEAFEPPRPLELLPPKLEPVPKPEPLLLPKLEVVDCVCCVPPLWVCCVVC